VSPKAHGAWLGAGAGAAVAGVVVGLLQAYVTHHPLPQADITAIYAAMPALLAYVGAYLAPKSSA